LDEAYRLHFPQAHFYRKGIGVHQSTGTAVVVNKQDVVYGAKNAQGGKLLLKMVLPM
jgi:hypothetical protein